MRVHLQNLLVAVIVCGFGPSVPARSLPRDVPVPLGNGCKDASCHVPPHLANSLSAGKEAGEPASTGLRLVTRAAFGIKPLVIPPKLPKPKPNPGNTAEPDTPNESEPRPIGAPDTDGKLDTPNESEPRPIGAPDTDGKPDTPKKSEPRPIGAPDTDGKPDTPKESEPRPIGAPDTDGKPELPGKSKPRPIGAPDPEEKPSLQACPRAAQHAKRAIGHGRIAKRAEEALWSVNPLKDALNIFGTPENTHAALDGAKTLLLNKFPKGHENAYVTGLEGQLKVETKKLTIKAGEISRTYKRGDSVFWRVRWDYDNGEKDVEGRMTRPAKGPHVNVEIGKPKVSFAFKLDPSQMNGANPDVLDGGDKVNRRKAMSQITRELNNLVKYDGSVNRGKSDGITWPEGGEDAAREALKGHFKNVADSPC